MNIVKVIKNICPPAKLYLGLSIVSILAILMQNLTDPYTYNCGNYSLDCPVHNGVLFLLKILYIVSWTSILHYLCKLGYSNISWLIVLFPFITMFLLIALLFLFL